VENLQASKREQIASLVGEDAADLAYRGTYWLRAADPATVKSGGISLGSGRRKLTGRDSDNECR